MTPFQETIISGIISGIVSGGLILLIQYLLDKKNKNKDNKNKELLGEVKNKYLAKDFLYNYIPGKITIFKVIEDFGQPLTKVEEYVDQEYLENDSKYYTYRYTFSNALVYFTTDTNDINIVSISLIPRINKEHPINCRFSYDDDDMQFGKALITQNIIENCEEFENPMFASWMYSAITSRYPTFRSIKYLYFTYVIYFNYENKEQMLNQEIDGICISSLPYIKPIIHFDEYKYS